MSNMILPGIDHLSIAARDPDKCADWYCTMLGYRKIIKHDNKTWLIISPDKTMLEIMPCDENPPIKRAASAAGFSHLALRTDDIKTAVKELEKKGVVFISDYLPAAGGGTIRNFYDPEGNLLQLVERSEKYFLALKQV